MSEQDTQVDVTTTTSDDTVVTDTVEETVETPVDSVPRVSMRKC